MKQVTITTEDNATVTVNGPEYSRLESDIQSQEVYRRIKREKFQQARNNYVTGINAVQGELDNWSTKDAAAIKASLGNIIIPALIRTMKAAVIIGDVIFDVNDDSGPTLSS